MGEPAKQATIKEVWATIKASMEASEKFRKDFEKSLKISKEERLKTERELKEAQQRTEEAQQRTEEAQQRTEEAQQRTEESLRVSHQKTEEVFRVSRQEVAEAQKETERAIRKLAENLNKASGDFVNKWGKFLENLVKGDLVKLLRGRDIEVTRVQPRLVYCKDKNEAGDFDLVAMNGKEIVAVKVKTTLTVEKVEKFINSLKRFKEYFPEYKDRRIYGGVAYLSEPEGEEAKNAEEYAKENGLFVIVSPGGESNVTTISNPQDFKPKVF